MKVKDVMTRDVVRVRTDTPFKKLVDLMQRHGMSGLPVTDGDARVIGMVSGGDLVVKGHRANRVRIHSPITVVDDPREHTRRADGLVAGELMTWPAVTIDADADLAAAARAMTLHGIRRLPVTTGGKLVGILTRGDVLKAFLRSDAEIEREIRQDILGRKVLEDTPDLTVEVADGVVRLRGTVRCRSTARVIGFHCDRLDGVTKVVNEIGYETDDLTAVPVSLPPLGPIELVL
jgi:CBS domain-containing protein